MQKPGFDPIADKYDAQFSHTPVGRLQRAVVQDFLKTKIGPGTTVLELNCGTGEDAIWLAQNGCTVLATDASPGMVKIAAAKIQHAKLQHRVQTQVLDLRNIPPQSAKHDLILSNFGGLNCLSPEDLKTFGQSIPTLLKPGGLFVAVFMGRFCWWETLYFALKGRLQQAVRRWDGGPVHAPLDTETSVPTWYFSPDEFTRYFPNLQVLSTQPIGFWLPPSYLNTWFGRRPRLLHSLFFLEKKCRGRLWAAAADHVMLVFFNGQD